MIQIVKRTIRSILNKAGIAVVRPDTVKEWERQSLHSALIQIKKNDVKINSVIDVGAAQGLWSVMCAQVFPHANYLLIEPLSEYEEIMQSSLKKIKRAKRLKIGLSNEVGEKVIHVHPDLVGSSFYLEKEESNVNGVARTVQVETLDSVCAINQMKPPYIIKIDVQGAELDVLESGLTALRNTEFLIIETSFFRFYENGKTIVDLIEFMKEQGFAPYDVIGHHYRPLDGALAQVDMCFVKEDSRFRLHHHYATAQQRDEQFKRLSTKAS